MTDFTTPLLVVDRIAVSPYQARAEIRIGGRPERVQLGMPGPGDGPYDKIISYEKVPQGLSESALRWVIDLMRRAHGGEDVRLPHDLSLSVREASDPWPVSGHEYASMTERDGGSSAIQTTQVTHDAPGLTTVCLQVHGTPAVVVVDKRDAPTDGLRFRFASGPHPWQLATEDSYAMLRALIRATRD